MPEYTVTTEVWQHPGEGGWHFPTLPPEVADELRARFGHAQRPFGSLPVRATLGRSSWERSVFADTKARSHLLPIEVDVRRRERTAAGGTVTLVLQVLE